MCHGDTSPNLLCSQPLLGPRLKITSMGWSLDFSQFRRGCGVCMGQSSGRPRQALPPGLSFQWGQSLWPWGVPLGRVKLTLKLGWVCWAGEAPCRGGDVIPRLSDPISSLPSHRAEPLQLLAEASHSSMCIRARGGRAGPFCAIWIRGHTQLLCPIPSLAFIFYSHPNTWAGCVANGRERGAA